MEARPVESVEREAVVEVGAPPSAVWGFISDVTRTPEWSPVVHRCEWTGGSTGPAGGARFRGYNRFNGFRWQRDCAVSECDEGRVFSFSTFGKDGGEQTRWRYSFEPLGADRTLVTLSYEIVSYPRWVRAARRVPGMRKRNEQQAQWNLEESLRRIRELLEAEPG